MASYLPVPGYPVQVVANGFTISVDDFDWEEICNVHQTPSFTGGGKMEHVPGMVSGHFSCSGTINGLFNPFTHGIRAQQRIPIAITITGGGSATDDDAIVERIRYKGSANGVTTWELSVVMDWNFTDFGGGIVGQ